MKVGIFTDNDFSKVNGVTTTLRAVLTHAPADIQPRVYTCESKNVQEPQYFAVGAWGMGIPFYREMKIHFPPVRRLLNQMRRDGVELVHLTTPGPVGLAAVYAASRLRLPMVGSFHTDLAAYTRLLSGSTYLGRIVQEYMRWPYGRCERILVPSLATRRTILSCKIAPDKIGLWKRGVSTELFTPAARSTALRESCGASDERPVLLYVGRVSTEKGLDLLPALTERLRRSQIRHRLVVVGDGPMRRALSDRCTGAIFTGTLSPREVAVAMASADLFVFPSRTDTAGNVVLEAQACGLPVLVTDEGGPRENMIDGDTGHVCGDLRAFARRCADLIWTPERRQRLSCQARAYAVTRRWDLALEPLYRPYREAGSARAGASLGVARTLVTEPAA
jgi:glycosyltransferase involved in cell wall biosynthesis